MKRFFITFYEYLGFAVLYVTIYALPALIAALALVLMITAALAHMLEKVVLGLTNRFPGWYWVPAEWHKKTVRRWRG